jgi:hypothetical protein
MQSDTINRKKRAAAGLPTGRPDEPECRLPPHFGRAAYLIAMRSIKKTNLARKEKKMGAKLGNTGRSRSEYKRQPPQLKRE